MIKKTEKEIIKKWGNLDTPTLSICCITFNHENFIAQALDSFLMQETNFPFEIIVRDDCSPDKTADIIKKYVKKYPNIIKPIFEKENQYSKGISSALAIYGKASGKYIAVCEGDDYWINSLKLQKQVDLLKSNENLKGVHTKVLYVDKNNKKLGESDRVEQGFEVVNYKYLAQRNIIHTCSFTFLKDIIDDDMYEMMNKAPVGDLVLFLKTSLLGDIAYIDELMSTYRIGVGVTKDWEYDKSFLNVLKIYDIFNEKYKKIIPITNISKRFYHYKLSNRYAERSIYYKAIYHYFCMLYFTKDVLFSSNYVVEKISFMLYIKTFIKILPFVSYINNIRVHRTH